MKRLFWVDVAEHARDLSIEYIARSNLDVALEQFDEVQRQTERLLRHPHLGRPGRKKNTRDLSINRTPFVVTYRIIGENIQVLHFRHTARRT